MTRFTADPTGLPAVVDAVRSGLPGLDGDRPDDPSSDAARVVGSVGFLGLAARLISPALGLAALGSPLQLGWANLWWRRGRGTHLQLAVEPGEATSSGSLMTPGAVDSLWQLAVRPVLDLGGVVADRYRVSPRIVSGNVASAIFGAATVIAANAAGAADPAVRGRAGQLTTDLLARPELAGAGTIFSSALPSDTSFGTERNSFRRNSCCLLYRIPGSVYCGDCVLRTR